MTRCARFRGEGNGGPARAHVDLAITVAEFARMSARRIFQAPFPPPPVIPPPSIITSLFLIAIKQRSMDERARASAQN